MFNIKMSTVGYYRNNPNGRGENKIFLENIKISVDKSKTICYTIIKQKERNRRAVKGSDMKGDYVSNRTQFLKMLDRCCNGTIMSWNNMDYIKLTETVIENVTNGTKYFKGLDF